MSGSRSRSRRKEKPTKSRRRGYSNASEGSNGYKASSKQKKKQKRAKREDEEANAAEWWNNLPGTNMPQQAPLDAGLGLEMENKVSVEELNPEPDQQGNPVDELAANPIDVQQVQAGVSSAEFPPGALPAEIGRFPEGKKAGMSPPRMADRETKPWEAAAGDDDDWATAGEAQTSKPVLRSKNQVNQENILQGQPPAPAASHGFGQNQALSEQQQMAQMFGYAPPGGPPGSQGGGHQGGPNPFMSMMGMGGLPGFPLPGGGGLGGPPGMGGIAGLPMAGLTLQQMQYLPFMQRMQGMPGMPGQGMQGLHGMQRPANETSYGAFPKAGGGTPGGGAVKGTPSAIELTNVPDALMDRAAIKEYFERFGHVLRILLFDANRVNVVFAHQLSATAALSQPSPMNSEAIKMKPLENASVDGLGGGGAKGEGSQNQISGLSSEQQLSMLNQAQAQREQQNVPNMQSAANLLAVQQQLQLQQMRGKGKGKGKGKGLANGLPNGSFGNLELINSNYNPQRQGRPPVDESFRERKNERRMRMEKTTKLLMQLLSKKNSLGDSNPAMIRKINDSIQDCQKLLGEMRKEDEADKKKLLAQQRKQELMNHKIDQIQSEAARRHTRLPAGRSGKLAGTVQLSALPPEISTATELREFLKKTLTQGEAGGVPENYTLVGDIENGEAKIQFTDPQSAEALVSLSEGKLVASIQHDSPQSPGGAVAMGGQALFADSLATGHMEALEAEHEAEEEKKKALEAELLNLESD